MDDHLVVTLLRHGMTDENERSAYISWTDSPLNEKGQKMAEALADLVRPPDLLFSSSSVRCLETARILFPGQTVISIDDLKEMHFGDWEGKTYEELRGLQSYRAWLDDPFIKGPDGGERFQEFKGRVERGWRAVKAQTMASGAKYAAVVTHGGVIRTLLSELAPEKKTFFDWKVPLAGGYEIVWTKEGFRRGEACISCREVPITEKVNG